MKKMKLTIMHYYLIFSGVLLLTIIILNVATPSKERKSIFHHIGAMSREIKNDFQKGFHNNDSIQK